MCQLDLIKKQYFPDSSDASMDAADYATAISQRYNAELYALLVIHADVDLYRPHVTSELTRNMRNEGL